ncbi:type II secretion system secretin GspD [Thiomicrorhabdus sp. zzn3]|uniref:type II secretion system secretin GspD n=1 Tax=Thiomicrorhabdus sp. zzn3 TaxID=3039775 RepID=UPI0024368276|nr:type II secretion system secretin GspD [Thiomicrorhabdus sp. zzn3]MDG6777316.1 type II secretion system secretin GspD [Thiomicrorhabdus sp. zzn3]
MRKLSALFRSLSLAGLLAVSSPLIYSSVVMADEGLQQSFKQAEISTVIEAVAKITGHNFVIDPRVKGKVTLIAPEPMSPDALYQTLLTILNVHGYTAVPSENVIKIVPANLARDQLPYRHKHEESEAWVSEVISVKNVSASKLVAVLRPLVAREGHLVALAESNKLIVTDTVANIQRIKKVLQRVDVDTQSGYEILELKHASAEEVAKTLRNVLPKGVAAATNVKVSYDERSNRVILVGDEAKRMMLRALVAELDVQVPTQGRVQVIYLRYAKAKELVPVLQALASNRSLLISEESQPEGAVQVPVAAEGEAAPAMMTASVGSQDTKTLQERISIEADERMNALVISAPPAMVAALKDVIKQLDIRRAQVLIEAIFVEISETKAAELGVEWGANGPNGGGLINFSGTIPALLSGDPATQISALGRGVTTGLGEVESNGYGWGALIRALNSDSNSNVLATPSLLTLDNEEAEIVVGREVPFQTGSYTSTTTSVTSPFTTVERKNVGLKLKVKPQINEGDEIYLDIDQEVSDVLPKDEAVDIQTTKRQIKTRVIVGDGNVIVLGGLINERETEVVSKVPGLGDIPGLGALFRSKQNEREKVNLMIFLRPVIVRDQATSDYYSQKKYSLIQGHQEHMLHKYDSELLDGLRPRMPTIEQWQKNEPATPFGEEVDRPAQKAEETKSGKPVLKSNEADQPDFSGVEELLDIDL